MVGPGRDFKLKDISIVMSFSLHCQNCKKCRRRVVVTLPPHRRHIAATSPPHRRHIAAALPPHCRQVAATLPPDCRHIAATLPPHCRHTSPPQLPQDLISANKVLFWPNRTLLAEIRSCGSCGGEVAAMRRQCGGNVAATWRQCGAKCAATLPPHCRHLAATAATGPYFCQ